MMVFLLFYFFSSRTSKFGHSLTRKACTQPGLHCGRHIVNTLLDSNGLAGLLLRAVEHSPFLAVAGVTDVIQTARVIDVGTGITPRSVGWLSGGCTLASVALLGPVR